MNILIAHEYSMTDQAKELQLFLEQRELKLEIHGREAFPIGDSMNIFLSNMSSRFDLVFMLIANNSNGYFWISNELKRQHIMGNFQNIYPVFLNKSDVPEWWNDQEQNFIIMTNINSDYKKFVFFESS
jgi:hypothetical protein